MTMPRTNTGRLILAVWMAAVLALLIIAFSWDDVRAHDEPIPEVTMCQGEDEIGVYTFPVGEMTDLFELCKEVDGTVVTVPDPGGTEMVRIMWDFGLYNPYWIIEDIFFQDTELEDEEPPE